MDVRDPKAVEREWKNLKSKANSKRKSKPNSMDDSQTSRCVQRVCGAGDGKRRTLVCTPGWQRATHTCSDLYQFENKTKYLTPGALRGVDGLTFDARGSRLAGEFGRRDCVTGES